jgi:hypothetical protein
MVKRSTLYYIIDNTESIEAENASAKALEIEFKDVFSKLPSFKAPEHCVDNVLKALQK